MMVPPPPIQELAPPAGRVLVLAPHPDDEVIGCGGAIALHSLQGDPVHVMVAFDGALAHPELRREEAGARRRAESLGAARILGAGGTPVTHEFWGLEEGHRPTLEQARRGAARIDALLRERAPDTVYAPWSGDSHVDHQALVVSLRLALQEHPSVTVRGYEVWSPLRPTVLLDVTGVVSRKRKALEAHESQGGPDVLSHRALGMSAWRSAQVGGECRFAEAYTPITRSPREDAA